MTEPETLLAAKFRIRHVAIAPHATGYLLAYANSSGHVTLEQRDLAGRVLRQTTSVAIPGAQSARGLYAVGDRYILMTDFFCPTKQDQCLQFVGLDARGNALGPVFEDYIREWFVPMDIAVDVDSVNIAQENEYLPPKLMRYTLTASGAIDAQSLLDLTGVTPDRDYEVHFGGARGGFGWVMDGGPHAAVMWSQVHPAPVVVDGLVGVSNVLGHIVDEAGLTFLYRTPGSHLRVVRILWTGKLVSSAPVMGEPPEPFANKVEVTTATMGSRLMLTRRDILGKELIRPIQLVRYGSTARGATHCDQGRADCAVIWSDGDTHSRVYFARLMCRR